MDIRNFLFIFSCCLLLSACETGSTETKPEEKEIEVLQPPERPCGNPVLVDVRDSERRSVGVLETLNDGENLWLVYSPNISNRPIKAHLYIGPAESIPRDGRGNDLMSEFPIKVNNEEGAIGWMYHHPLDSLPECFEVLVCLHIADRELVRPLPNQIRFAWASGNDPQNGIHSISYCPAKCDPTADLCSGGLVAGQFRTFTASDWAEDLQQSPWSEYLDQKFSATFPEGLTLGCEKKLTFDSPEAVRGFLPSNGAGSVLTNSEDNPQPVNNGLAAEICALSLSIGFDNLDDGFSLSPVRLRSLVIARGPFAGWSVRDLLNEANTVLGGCTSNYSAGQMEEVIRSVNENFSRATVNRNFLRCEGG